MTNDPTPEEVRASIVPRSDQLNADDLITGTLTVTITNVARGSREQPITVEIEGHQPYKPCKSMRRVMIAVYGDDPKQWVGRRLTLYCDPEVKFGGVKIGGIRISHMSGIEEPKTFLITTSRAKRSEVTIYPIKDLTDDERAYVTDATQEIHEAKTKHELQHIGGILKNKSKTIQDAVRPVYAKRYGELINESD